MQLTNQLRHYKIGALTLDSTILVAPMVGITDVPFRAIAREMGAGLVTTEMVTAEAVVRNIDASLKLLDFPPDVHPVAAQLVGNDAIVMAEAAQVCVARGAQAVDVNLGCPVRKVVSRGSGAALARDIDATGAVFRAMVNAVSVPVTAKMRLGWDYQTINAPELARALQDVGVKAVTVHGRTRCQGYSGNANWDAIARVKAAVDIPVFGSGDVNSASQIAHHIRSGHVDGVVIARGMLGNFHFLRKAQHFLHTSEELPEPSFAERIALARRHVEALVDYYGEYRAMKVGRKYVAWTIKGCAGASRLRAAVQDLFKREQLEEIFNQALAAGPAAGQWFQPVFTSGEG